MNRKTRATYYRADKVAAARHNAQTYAWAVRLREEAEAKAGRYLTAGLDALWEAVPAQTLPRSYGVNQQLGSPVTGKEIDRFGNYPYKGDALREPWKIVDPSSGYTFPTNEFGAYYKSGLDARGVFRPELADRSLLVNTLYPERGASWGVDDGFGWVNENGEVYTFVAYYLHWFVWYGAGGLVEDALRSFRDAYLYTGDMKYALPGIVLLDRVADLYPDMDISAYDRNRFLNSDGRKNTGKVVGSIWETSLVKVFVSAFDAFFPAMDDPAVVEYLSGRARKHGLSNPKSSGAHIRCNVEEGIVRQIYPAVRAAQICGNDGMHQSALAMAAVVYDSLPETKQWLDFVFQTGGLAANPYRVTGGNVLNSLVSQVDRDGHGNEASPGYNSLWLANHRLTADILDGYDLYPDADLYANPKFRKMFAAYYPLLLSESYTVNVGDTAAAGNPYVQVKLEDMVKAFDKFGDPIYAQVAFFLNGNRTDGLHLDIFSHEPQRIADRIGGIVAERGPLRLESVNLSGYGFAALRDGRSSDRTLRDFWMYYGRNTGHGHRDTLNVGLHAFGLDLSPDLGYPEYADVFDMHRAQWVVNTISHNTVVVDRRKQEAQWVAEPRHFDGGGFVQLIDVEAPKAYPQTSLYRRTTAMIRADGTNSYAVDLFRVKGGTEHHFSFHGAEGEVETEGLELVPQETGTYAGADVAYAQRTDDKDGPGYAGSGFHYLRNVARAVNPENSFSADWNVKDTWNVYGRGAGAETDVHVRLTMLGRMNEVALADGVPPQNKPGNPKTLRYLIAHRRGTDLDSLFASVIEPYKGSRFIASIESVDIRSGDALVTGNEATAIKVTLVDGRTDYIVHALDPDIVYTVGDKLQFRGFFGVYSERDGKRSSVYVHDGALLAPIGSPEAERAAASASGAVTGTIADFTRTLSARNELVVEPDAGSVDPADWTGKTVFVEGDGVRNAAYPIRAVEPLAGGRYRLDIGDLTLVRGFADDTDFAKGYRYDIAEGAKFRIPLTLVFSS
ncbi:heparinase II/III domain-containing protein [Paenibacillus sp. GYB003]|uniref:heparinase II/III domain-containing protein n=1 Tax=Paenibacillus sp. GYB003 TaxID=2994392 RepID=UPI002F96B673